MSLLLLKKSFGFSNRRAHVSDGTQRCHEHGVGWRRHIQGHGRQHGERGSRVPAYDYRDDQPFGHSEHIRYVPEFSLVRLARDCEEDETVGKAVGCDL